jgi:hypothetical protein
MRGMGGGSVWEAPPAWHRPLPTCRFSVVGPPPSISSAAATLVVGHPRCPTSRHAVHANGDDYHCGSHHLKVDVFATGAAGCLSLSGSPPPLA